ncbi:MAG: glycosyltransferase family 2 protein [Bacilli bacterium]|nr:glycosyltransferase family 2 protein [Bacilli bacterium]
MKTGIVILNYNDYDTTKDMIERIKSYKCLNHILIVDNKSTDRSYSKLKKLENKNIEVIKTDDNKGYAYGNNFGVRYLDSKYKIDNIIISNPDVIVSEDVIDTLINDLKNKEDISIIAPIVEEKGIISRGWKLPGFKEDLLSNINYFHKYSKKLMSYDEEYYNNKLSRVEAVHGCFFMIRLKDFKEVGLFDENTFLYYEENILGRKLKEKGMFVYIDNTVKVIHDLSVSVDKTYNSIKKYKILKNSQKYYEKNYNNLNIFGIILLRIFYYISLIISYIVIFITNIKRK